MNSTVSKLGPAVRGRLFVPSPRSGSRITRMMFWKNLGASLRAWFRGVRASIGALRARWFPARRSRRRERPPLYPVVVFPLHRGHGNAPPSRWKKCHPSTMRRFKAELTCPSGHALTLRAHSITMDGRVQPSVVCRSPGCKFHEFVQLKDWDAGYLQ